MTSALQRREIYLLLAVVAAAGGWLLMPVIPQPQAYHGFADQRNFLSVPRAADVLSNLPFVAVGLFGFWRLARPARPLSGVAHTSLFVFFTGFFLTGFGSGYYHWDPNDARLVLDRLPMTIAFAGLLGALVAERISQRSGLAMLFLILVVGPASVFYWKSTGDLSLYVMAQFGAMLATLVILCTTAPGSVAIPWWQLLVWYAVAKVAEAADKFVWHSTGELFAGHAIKHLAAALGALAIANALRPARPPAEAAAASSPGQAPTA